MEELEDIYVEFFDWITNNYSYTGADSKCRSMYESPDYSKYLTIKELWRVFIGERNE